MKIVLILFFFQFLSSCDRQAENEASPPVVDKPIVLQTTSIQETEPQIDNKSYLFNVSNHTIEELEALLIRAEEVSQAQPADFEDLEIVMILHGPDIDWFTHKNMEHNKKLVELAAKLDAYDVIDMKVCETTMKQRGVEKDDLPAFIESVPYAPTAINELLNDGYINL